MKWFVLEIGERFCQKDKRCKHAIDLETKATILGIGGEKEENLMSFRGFIRLKLEEVAGIERHSAYDEDWLWEWMTYRALPFSFVLFHYKY